MDTPIVLKNFLSDVDVDYLNEWLTKNEFKYDEYKSSGDNYWDSRCIHYSNIEDSMMQSCLKSIMYMMREIVEKSDLSDQYVYVEKPQFVRWQKGWELPPHADNIEQDNLTPNASPWRSHGAVIYLNDDFEGGEIYYPNLNRFEIKPEPGMAVLHRAGIQHTHGVKKITKGTRHTISTFFTYESHHSVL